jgi:transposase InsO family protein
LAHAWDVKKTADEIPESPVADAGTAAQRRRGARHDHVIITHARTAYQRSPRSFLRGAGRQVAQRAQEHAVRRRVLARVRWATWHGWSRGRCAAALQLDPATLATWVRRWNDLSDRLAPAPLGAKPLTCSPLQRRDVFDFLALHGTDLGVAVLQDHFPGISRRDLGCLLHLTRTEVDAIAAGGWYRCVTWHGPGRVWALDHTEPPAPIDGQYRFVLTVRDLASGCTLATHAVTSPDAASTIHVLRALFAQHGAPLVLKADNGGAFTAADTRAYLDANGVTLLLSPAYTPSYNGACEAGNGTVKHLTHQLACRHDRPEHWRLDDLEAARLLANRRITDRTQTHSPEQRFADRTPISSDERARFHIAVAAAQQRRAADSVIATNHGMRKIAADALRRQAITDALSGTGVITIQSRRLRLCYPKVKVG